MFGEGRVGSGKGCGGGKDVLMHDVLVRFSCDQGELFGKMYDLVGRVAKAKSKKAPAEEAGLIDHEI